VYYTNVVYEVNNGALARNEISTVNAPSKEHQYRPGLYFYDPRTDSSRKLSFEEVVGWRLDPSSKSPDGFEIVSGRGGGGFFPFFEGGSDYGARYLSGHGLSRRLNLFSSDLSYNYGYNFQFLGWVIK
jgi:hypothetical protein